MGLARGILASLNPLQRSAWPHVVSGVAAGLSANRIGEALRLGGLGINRGVLLELVRAAKGIEAAAVQLRNIRLDRRPDPSRLPEAAHSILRNYSFRVQVTGTDTATGQPIRRHITISTDTVLTRGQLEDLAAEIVESGNERYGVEVESTLLVGGVRQPQLTEAQ